MLSEECQKYKVHNQHKARVYWKTSSHLVATHAVALDPHSQSDKRANAGSIWVVETFCACQRICSEH